MFKNISLELRFTAREARTVSASGPPIVPSFREGKKPMFFPLAAPLFPSANRRSSLPPKVGPAAGRRTKARPKRLNGLFYLLDLILNASMGQIRRMGGRKAHKILAKKYIKIKINFQALRRGRFPTRFRALLSRPSFNVIFPGAPMKRHRKTTQTISQNMKEMGL